MSTTLKLGLSTVLITLAITPFAFASHTWGSYHWARTANPFTLKLGDNVSSAWDPYLRTAAADWSQSSVLDMTVVTGASLSNPKYCRAKTGQGEVCNAKYGSNGWLGIAQIYVSSGHITAGIVKLNDTYFNSYSYNKPEWRTLVMCQEVGHILGLGHQDESMSNKNLGTCMDYTNSPLRDDGAGGNLHPNAHDYSLLETIYQHLDTSTTLSQTSAASAPAEVGDDPREWGAEIRSNGRASVFERNLGNGQKVFTHVFWAEEANSRLSRGAEHDH